jgi:hypothetical protein
MYINPVRTSPNFGNYQKALTNCPRNILRLAAQEKIPTEKVLKDVTALLEKGELGPSKDGILDGIRKQLEKTLELQA